MINRLLTNFMRRIKLSFMMSEGYLPIHIHKPGDIFVVGYPKSGNTWMQVLVAGTIYGILPEYCPDTVIQEIYPDVHYKKYYKRYREPMIFWSHHLPIPAYRRVIYLVRDGRDVMVSYYHYLMATTNGKVDFFRMVKEGKGLFPCKWHEHVEAWLLNPYNAEMIIVKYEELHADPINVLKRVCEFIGEERSESIVKMVVESATLEKMKSREKKYGWDNPKWPKNVPFIRKGKIGTYKEEMPPEVLEAFIQDAYDTLKKLGYI